MPHETKSKMKHSYDGIQNLVELHIVHIQKISILPPQKGLEFPGGGGEEVCRNQKCKEMCSALLEFPAGWGGV